MKRLLIPVFVLWISGQITYAQQMKPEETEIWEPVPAVVTPGGGMTAPSDAIVLFDGKNFDQWESVVNHGPVQWLLGDGAMTVVKSTTDIQTKESFGDCQLHIEWRTPAVVVGESQGRGNSGIFLQSHYELQVLDSYNNRTYSNGQAGSIYKQSIPLVNACMGPGQWQTYDIIYTAPRFADNGNLITPAYVTVLQNGVLIDNHFQIKGSTEYIGLPKYTKHGDAPLVLQCHGDKGNPVSFRNIWIRKL
jgi:hypothetical protein